MNSSILTLYRNFQDGTATSKEVDQVLEYISMGAYLEEWEFVLSELSDSLLQEPKEAFLAAEQSEGLRKRILESARQQHLSRPSVPPQKRRKLLVYGIVSLLVVVLTLLSYPIWKSLFTQEEAYQLADLEQIVPGKNKAILTLPNGKSIALQDEHGGLLTNERLEYADGRSILDAADIQALTGASREYLRVETPRGGTYAVTLPDGSKVLLNSASSLAYPLQFAGNERLIELSGEAYFDVISNPKKPFRVKSKDQVVEVLGTKFNVSVYPENPISSTTLAEGKIQLKTNRTQVILSPGQQSLNEGGKVKLRKVDVKSQLAWVDNRFDFEDKSFRQVLAELGRWYDFEVEFEGPVPAIELIGGAYRTDRISTVLRILTGAGVAYKMVYKPGEGNKLIILNKKGN